MSPVSPVIVAVLLLVEVIDGATIVVLREIPLQPK
jgi:hypothetical protein